MRTTVLVIALAVSPAIVVAATATQTDWSGGPGNGPTATAWTSAFAAAESISWGAVPGQLALASEPLEEAIKQQVDSDFAGAASVVAADVDGDGRQDVIAAAIGAGEIAWWRNDGSGTWQRTVIADGLADPIGVHAVDLDGDGDTDVLGAIFAARRFTVWWNDGGTPPSWREQDLATDFGRPHWISTADVDGDGDRDVVGAAAGSEDIVWWRQDGGDPVEWHEQVVADHFAGARAVEGADLDGDGDTDLVGVALDADEVSWWRNDGGEPVVWSQQLVSAALNGAHGLALADLDRDGDTDIVAAGYVAGRLTWWRNDGGEPLTWTEQVIDYVFRGALTVAVADLDGDGDLDVAGAGDLTDQVAWWANGGGELPTWDRQVVERPFIGAWPVTATDLDRDGDIDLLAGADESGQVAWWQVSRFRPSGTLVSHVLDTATGFERGRCDWRARTPPGTELTVALRAWDDPADRGAWVVASPGPVPASLAGRRFLQYRVTLTTSDPAVSPLLEELSCSWLGEADRTPRAAAGRLTP